MDDEFDDTFIEMPDEYVIDDVQSYVNSDELGSVNGIDKEAELQQTEQPKPLVEVKEEEPHDDWGF